jgi:DNA-binding protein H-NS
MDSILAKISVLQQKTSAMEAAKRDVIAELRKLIGHYDIQASELFSDVEPPAVSKPAVTKSAPAVTKPVPAGRKAVLPPKYQDPVTGRTWSGHGKRPLWLIGDKEKYLIAASSSEAKADAAKPKKNAPGGADWKSRVAKLAEVPKSTKTATKAAKYTGKKRGRKPKKATAPENGFAVEAAESNPADLPSTAE